MKYPGELMKTHAPVDFGPGRGKFPALRRLKLQGMDLGWIVTVLASITHSALESVDLNFTSHTPASWKQVFDNLLPYRATLTSLILDEKEEGDFGDEDAIDQNIIEPLLSLPNLAHVILRPHHPLDVGDQLLEEMSKAWPRLRHLALDCDTWVRSLRITLQGLLPLVKGCPHLEHLELCINAKVTPFSLEAPPGRGVSGVKLTTLVLGYSPIANSAKVAAFLMDVFPNLTEIQGSSSMWVQTQAHLKTFRAIRQWPAL